MNQTSLFTRASRLAITGLGALLLSACISLGPDVPDQLISLTPAEQAPAGDMGGGSVAQAMVVLDPDADQRLDVLRVPVQIDPSSVAYLENAVWVEKPARQFRRLLAETIRARTGNVVVEGSDYEVGGKTVVSGRLVDMGYDAIGQAVVVRYDALVEDGQGGVRSRRFETRIPGIAAEAAAVAPALNQAANQIAGEVATWLVGS